MLLLYLPIRKKSILKPLRSVDKDLSYIWLGDFTWQKEDGLLIPGRQTGEEKFQPRIRKLIY